MESVPAFGIWKRSHGRNRSNCLFGSGSARAGKEPRANLLEYNLGWHSRVSTWLSQFWGSVDLKDIPA